MQTGNRAGMIASFRRSALLAAILVFATGPGVANAASGSAKNPLLGKPAAISAGRAIYAQRCMICHGRQGGRGPDIFRNDLSDSEFLDTVMNGKDGSRGQMPAWSGTLTKQNVWQVEAFLKSRPHY